MGLRSLKKLKIGEAFYRNLSEGQHQKWKPIASKTEIKVTQDIKPISKNDVVGVFLEPNSFPFLMSVLYIAIPSW